MRGTEQGSELLGMPLQVLASAATPAVTASVDVEVLLLLLPSPLIVAKGGGPMMVLLSLLLIGWAQLLARLR